MIDFLIHVRQQLNGERAAGAGDLEHHDHHYNGLAHVAEGNRQGIDQQAEHQGGDGPGGKQQRRLHALDLQHQQVPGHDDGGLNLAHDEKQEVPAEKQLVGLGVHQPLQAGVGLENGHQHDAAHPDGQNGIEGGHALP